MHEVSEWKRKFALDSHVLGVVRSLSRLATVHGQTLKVVDPDVVGILKTI